MTLGVASSLPRIVHGQWAGITIRCLGAESQARSLSAVSGRPDKQTRPLGA